MIACSRTVSLDGKSFESVKYTSDANANYPLKSKHASNLQGSERTPSMYAISNRCGPAPTLALALILSMRPGKVGVTETIMAVAARQDCQTVSEK